MSRYCYASANGVVFGHHVIDYSSGEVMAFCEVYDAAAQYSGAAYYLSTQAGAVSALCIVVYDVDTFTAGYWEFRADAPGERAIYHDSSSPDNGYVVSLTTCVG